jgi:hydroxymethylbilane synthase
MAMPFPMLPVDARIGTASARRQAQLLHARPNLRIGLIRGNVQTRLNRLDTGDFAATLLAVSGLRRLGVISAAVTVLVAPELMVPAAGQGIIGVTARADDERALALLGRINDASACTAAAAERSALRALDGSCRTAIGAYARPLPSGDLFLSAVVGRADGPFLLKRWRRVQWPTRHSWEPNSASRCELIAQRPYSHEPFSFPNRGDTPPKLRDIGLTE